MPLEFAPIFIILLRTFIPFMILRFPLLGGILAMLADAADIMIFEAFGYGFLGNLDLSYQFIDKGFDMWYLFFEFLVVLKWSDMLARKTGMILFGWRAIGFVLLLILGLREVFFFAPNIFEFFFLAMLIIWKFNDKFKLGKKSLIIILLIVGIPNIIKEYIMHIKYPGQIGTFFKDNFFWWLYD